MDKFTKIIEMLQIENEIFELEVLKDWIDKEGIDFVYEECLKIVENKNANGD